jgi:hypothetical protein
MTLPLPVFEPVWTLLTPDSRSNLISDDGEIPSAIRVKPCTSSAHALDAPLLKSVRVMVERAVTNEGLKMTPSGYLSRADTKPVFDAVHWPDWSKENFAAVTKVINECEVLPIHLARITAQKAGLLRRQGKKLVATKVGRALLAEENAGELLVRLTEASFWKVRQDAFDGVPFGPWPQDHVGVVLWCVGAAASAWQDSDDLLSICTIPFVPIAGLHAGHPEFAFFARILRPAIWLGLLAFEERKEEGERWPVRKKFVRKTPLFDQVLRFEVEVLKRTTGRH